MGDFFVLRARQSVKISIPITLELYILWLTNKFGMPGNETIGGHPYSHLGMKSFSFYELKNSDLIKILTFHDNMFECVARNFECREEKTSIYNQVVDILNDIMFGR